MKIVGLRCENFMRLKVFHLEPKGNVIKLTGANASGKSSALEAIALALVGARGGPSAPVRKGAGRGAVALDLGDDAGSEFIVTRMWNEGGDSKGEMWIEAKDGRRYGTPQKMLDEMMAKMSFDPLAFKRMVPKEQKEELRKLLDLDEELDAIAAEEQADYATRREQTALLNALKAQRTAIQYPEDLPSRPLDIDAMTNELASVATFNTGIERERMEREQWDREHTADAQKVDLKHTRIKALEAEIAQLNRELKEDEKNLDANAKRRAKWKPLEEPKDAQKISEAITAARAVNSAISRRADAEQKDKAIAEVSEKVASLSRAIDEHRQKAVNLIATAKYPVPGLGFEEDAVTYNGLPFAQASDAEQIKVSIAMGMAGNPKLRVMRIKDGSLLDDDSMKVVEEMAVTNDFQVFVEVVDTSGKVGVYLVDGEIAAIDGEKVAPPTPRLSKLRKPRGAGKDANEDSPERA